MKEMFKSFWNNLKNYINIIFKLDFGELFVYLLELILVIVTGLLTYIPVSLVKDLIFNIIALFNGNMDIVYNIINVIFSLISLFVFAVVFIYCFNIRYAELKKNENEKKAKKNKNDEDIELPTMKK